MLIERNMLFIFLKDGQGRKNGTYRQSFEFSIEHSFWLELKSLEKQLVGDISDERNQRCAHLRPR